MAGRWTTCPVCGSTLRVPSARSPGTTDADVPTLLDIPAVVSSRA